MAGARVLLELGPDDYGTFGSGIYGAGLFGAGGDGPDPQDVTGPCLGISIQRGLTADGVTEVLEPGLCRVILKGAEFNPLSYEHTRPGRPLRVLTELVDEDDDVTRTPAFSGTITKAVLGVDKDGSTRVVVTALDLVSDLAATPYEVAHDGTFRQRLEPVLEAAGVPYVIHDDEADLAAGTLPTNQRTALGQLTLARDTTHGYFFVDRENVLQAYADRQRSHDAAELVLTDGTVAGVAYVGIDPGFDTDDLINVLTIETLTAGDPTEDTFVDEDSVEEWLAARQSITVNDGDAATHANRFRARLNGAGMTVKTVTLNAGKLDALEVAAGLELYDVVRVVHAGTGVDQDQQVIRLEHTITPNAKRDSRWITTATTRRREVLPLRWSDVPAGMTWDDVPAGMTWDDSIFWHPA